MIDQRFENIENFLQNIIEANIESKQNLIDIYTYLTYNYKDISLELKNYILDFISKNKDNYAKKGKKNIEEGEEEEEEEEEESEKSENHLDKEIKDRNNVIPIYYCKDCKKYICNKCHLESFNNHKIIYLNKDKEDIEFIGLCKENNHFNKLEYFCKTHNQLCCSSCICKIKSKGNGKHRDCEVCSIKKIKNIKKNKLIENIKYLENLSNNIQNYINELKNLFEKINAQKDELKINIQKIFTNLRNEVNNREDFILQEIDKQFDNLFLKEDLIKKSEKLPKKINALLEMGKTNDNDWKDKNKLNSLINYCIQIENNIRDIYVINDNIEKCKLNNEKEVKFSFDDKFLEKIRGFGNIYIISNKKNEIKN